MNPEDMNPEDLLGLLIPVTYLVFLITEHLFPARDFPRVRGWVWVGAAFTTILMTLNVIIPLALPLDWAQTHALLHGATWPLPLQILLGFLASSFVDFLYHRAEHASGVLWRWSHQIHHSAVRVDISGSAYTSPVEVSASVVYSLATTILFLGLSPLASAAVGYLMAFYAMFQHWNVRTPRWLGYLIQRPESHCLHHEYGVHARNYSVLPLWDILAGSFQNPDEFHGRVGFHFPAARRVGAMLAGIDVLQTPSGNTPQPE